jgi:hypothetical protein
MTRPRALLFATALPFLSAALPSQDGPVLGILNHLQSHDLAQVARGAHQADVHGLKELVPELRKTLHRLTKLKATGVRYTSMVLFDALIRLKAKLPPDEIEPWLGGHTLPAAMVLMARQPKEYEELLLGLFETHAKDPWKSECWLAAGNLLVSFKSKKIASRILKGLHAVVSMNLHDVGGDIQETWSVGLGGGAGATSSGRIRIPANYPPVALYRLEKKKLPKTRLLAPGPKPVYYRRLSAQGCRTRSFYSLEDTSRRKLEWMCALLDIKMETQPFQLSDGTNVAWQDSDAYVRKIKVEKEKVEGSFRSLINRMQLKGLVTKEEASGIKPTVSIHVFDHRQDDKTPLPEIDGVKVQKVEQKKG